MPATASEGHIDLVYWHILAGVSDGAEDPAPVCVGTEDGRLDQAGTDNALGHGSCRCLGGCSRHTAGKEFRGALAIGSDFLTEIQSQGPESPAKDIEVISLRDYFRILRQTVGHDDDHVVGGSVPVDADHVE